MPLLPPFVPLRAGHNVPAVPVPDDTAFAAHLADLASTSLTVTGYDGIDVPPRWPAGGRVYFFYQDGWYANEAAIGSWVAANAPHAACLGITVHGAAAACFDCEPGNGVPGDCPGFWHLSKAAGHALPVIYCPASWTTQIRQAMAAAGIQPSQYLLWSAHYGVGPHICGTCGYPPADGTQWTDTGTYDISVLGPRFVAYFFPPKPKPPTPPKVKPPTPAPPTVTEEDSDVFVESEGPTVGPVGHRIIAGQFYILSGGHRILAAENKNELGYAQYKAIYGDPKPLNTEAISRWPHT